MQPEPSGATPIRFGFLLLPHFTLTAFSGLLDVLRLAGDEGDNSQPVRCSWQVIDETLAPVRSSSGIQVVQRPAIASMSGTPNRFFSICCKCSSSRCLAKVASLSVKASTMARC